MSLWEIESEIHAGGISPVCGVDEAGRGPLAGPVYAAAVILPLGIEIAGLTDSKKLSEKKREELYPVIIEKALYYGIGFADVSEIEELNILNATYLAMNRAIQSMGIAPTLALIDGNMASGVSFPNRTVVKGDSKCASIAAASIIAKVTRDRYMAELAVKYPEYGFEKHKGYGTKQHTWAIQEHGACAEHRPFFLRKINGN